MNLLTVLLTHHSISFQWCPEAAITFHCGCVEMLGAAAATRAAAQWQQTTSASAHYPDTDYCGTRWSLKRGP